MSSPPVMSPQTGLNNKGTGLKNVNFLQIVMVKSIYSLPELFDCILLLLHFAAIIPETSCAIGNNN